MLASLKECADFEGSFLSNRFSAADFFFLHPYIDVDTHEIFRKFYDHIRFRLAYVKHIAWLNRSGIVGDLEKNSFCTFCRKKGINLMRFHVSKWKIVPLRLFKLKEGRCPGICLQPVPKMSCKFSFALDHICRI